MSKRKWGLPPGQPWGEKTMPSGPYPAQHRGGKLYLLRVGSYPATSAGENYSARLGAPSRDIPGKNLTRLLENTYNTEVFLLVRIL